MQQAAQRQQAVPDTSAMARAWWRIVPLIMLINLTSILDKQNVSFAKLQMVHDLRMTESAYGFASSLFFIGFVLAEIPSALGAQKYGCRLWLTRIMLTWGIATTCLVWCTSGSAFAAMRFMVGAAEGGLYPSVVFYYGLWFVKQHRIKALTVLSVGSALGSMLSSVLGGALLSLSGTWGLAGWQWVFIMTGAPAIILVPIVYLCLPSSPAEAKFLTTAEKLELTESVQQAQPVALSQGSILSVIWDVRVLLFAGAYTLLLTGYYGVIYWTPTVVKQFGVTDAQNGLLNAIPWVITVVVLIWVPRYFRIDKSILTTLAIIATIGLLCFFASVSLHSAPARFAAIALGTPCACLLLPVFWSFASMFFGGRKAPASIATITAYANLGGFVAQNMMPRVAHALGSPAAAMVVPGFCLLLLALAAVVIRLQPKLIPAKAS